MTLLINFITGGIMFKVNNVYFIVDSVSNS